MRALQHLRYLGPHNLEAFVLPRREQDGSCASVFESFSSCENQKAFGVLNPMVLSYLSGMYCQGTALERLMVSRIVEIEFFILILGPFLPIALIGVVEPL